MLQPLNGGVWSVALWNDLPIASRGVIGSPTVIRIVDDFVETSFTAARFAPVVLVDRIQGIRAVGGSQRLLDRGRVAGDGADGGDGVGRLSDTLAPEFGAALARGFAGAFHLQTPRSVEDGDCKGSTDTFCCRHRVQACKERLALAAMGKWRRWGDENSSPLPQQKQGILIPASRKKVWGTATPHFSADARPTLQFVRPGSGPDGES
jgi:hypothetical protein